MKKLILSIVAMLTMATSAFAQIGNLSADLVFTPITPCRIVDTRVLGGTIAAGTARGFKAWSATGFAAQGGSATPCGIPQNTNVAALALNLVVVGPAADGYITAYPTGVAQPNASTLNYVAGDIVANGAIVKVSQASLATDWTVFTYATTHFVADVTGYYAKPVATALQCVLQPLQAVSLPVGYDSFIYTTSTCSAGYAAVSPYCWKGFATGVYSTGGAINNGAWCGWTNLSGAAQTVYQSTNCCQIPGR